MATVTSYTKAKIDTLLVDNTTARDVAIAAAIATSEAKPRPGELIAQVNYRPATLGTVTPTTTAFVDADATNLAVTFTAPTTGIVDVILEALLSTTVDSSIYWNLRSGAADVVGTDGQAMFRLNQNRVSMTSHITGLTPGTSYTYKWGIARKQGAGAVAMYFGGIEGPAVMRVLAGKA